MTQKENSLFSFCVFYIYYSQKVDETVIFKICSGHGSAIVVHMSSVCLFFKVSYLVVAAFLEFDRIFFYRFIENA